MASARLRILKQRFGPEVGPLKAFDEWALKFLKEDHVFVHPGYFFDFDKGAHIVLSLLTPVEIFQKGLTRILKRIETELS